MSGPQPEIYEIHCILERRTTSFSVKIAKDKSVDELKKALKEKRPRVLDDVDIDVDELILYQVDVPDNDDLEYSVQDIMIMSGGPSRGRKPLMPLTPRMKLADVYSETPPKRTVHIVIRIDSGKQLVNVAVLYVFH
jgi:hypothetical protein